MVGVVQVLDEPERDGRSRSGFSEGDEATTRRRVRAQGRAESGWEILISGQRQGLLLLAAAPQIGVHLFPLGHAPKCSWQAPGPARGRRAADHYH